MTGFAGHLMSTRNGGQWIVSTAAGFYVRNAVKLSGIHGWRFTVGWVESIVESVHRAPGEGEVANRDSAFVTIEEKQVIFYLNRTGGKTNDLGRVL